MKFLGAEKAVEMSRRCIQIHGGYGYITEYGAEKLLRDAMVLPIYEGTSQIQSLMVMKDSLMGILKSPGYFFRGLGKSLWRGCFATDCATRRVARIQRRQHLALLYLLRRLAVKKLRGGVGGFTGEWDPKRDFALAMLHAERLTRLSIDAAVCETLLDQARAFPERREVLERYLERAEPAPGNPAHRRSAAGRAGKDAGGGWRVGRWSRRCRVPCGHSHLPPPYPLGEASG